MYGDVIMTEVLTNVGSNFETLLIIWKSQISYFQVDIHIQTYISLMHKLCLWIIIDDMQRRCQSIKSKIFVVWQGKKKKIRSLHIVVWLIDVWLTLSLEAPAASASRRLSDSPIAIVNLSLCPIRFNPKLELLPHSGIPLCTRQAAVYEHVCPDLYM